MVSLVETLVLIEVSACTPQFPDRSVSCLSHRAQQNTASATEQTRNARLAHGPSRPLRGILYAQQREDGHGRPVRLANWRSCRPAASSSKSVHEETLVKIANWTKAESQK
jgi:hypothetical protein